MAAQTGQHAVGLQLAHRYQLNELLARGGLCEVFRGEDQVLRRPIAVKVIPAALAETYLAALRRTAALSHPAAIAVYDALEQDGQLYVVQEYVPARPFSVYIDAGVPVERALALVGQLARAIGYAHAQGIAHGDLSPSAVLVDRHAMVRINNFALPPDTSYTVALERQIRAAAEAEAQIALQAGAPAPGAAARPDGATQDQTPGAMPVEAGGDDAPTATESAEHIMAERFMAERFMAERFMAERDVWALGALLWQLLTSPVPGEASAGRRFRADVPEPARALVRQCVYVSDGERIASADGLAGRIEAVAEELRSLRPSSTPPTPPALRAARDAAADMALWPEEEPIFAIAPRGRAESAADGGRGSANPPLTDDAPPLEGPWPPAEASEFNAPTDPVLDDSKATRPARHFGDTPVAPPAAMRLSPARALDDPTAPVAVPTAYPVTPSVPRWEVPGSDRPVAGRSQSGVSLPTVIVLGVILFVIFFVIGYIAPSLFGR